MTDLNETFKTLRKTAKEKCECGSKHFIAPMFHKDNCPYIILFAHIYSKGEIENVSIEEKGNEETGSKQRDLFQAGS